MSVRHFLLLSVATVAFAVPVHAQNNPRVDLSLYPLSDLFVSDGDSNAEPSFRSYTPGAALFVRLTSHVGVEADFSHGRVHTRDLGVYGRQSTPALNVIMGNLVVTAPTRSRVRPYVTLGLGNVHVSKSDGVGITESVSVASANIGGGAKVMFGRWGIRADYRYVAMEALDTDRAPAFLGDNGRRAHRIALGLVLASGR